MGTSLKNVTTEMRRDILARSAKAPEVLRQWAVEAREGAKNSWKFPEEHFLWKRATRYDRVAGEIEEMVEHNRQLLDGEGVPHSYYPTPGIGGFDLDEDEIKSILSQVS